MRNFKGFLIATTLLFSLFFIAVGSFVYLFHVDDYSQWITQQIKQSTGYDVRFEQFENRWLNDNGFSLLAVSLYEQQKRVLFIKRVDLQIKKLDMLQRQLAIQSIHLQDVEFDIDSSIMASNSNLSSETKDEQKRNALQTIAWQSLHIGKIQISGLNGKLQYEDKHLLLTDADIEMKGLSVIEQNQIQHLPTSIDLLTSFKALQVHDNKHSATLNDFQLSVIADLIQRQALLNINATGMSLQLGEQQDIPFEALQLSVQLEQNKLSLEHFSVNTLSGSLNLKAQAQLAINLLENPIIGVEQVTIESLLAKNMQLNIPASLGENSEPQQATQSNRLPIKKLWVKTARLENINIHSEEQQLPLTITALDAQINETSLIEEHLFIDLEKFTQQSGSFTLGFDYLQWQQTSLEHFLVSGSLSEEGQSLLLLNEILTTREQ